MKKCYGLNCAREEKMVFFPKEYVRIGSFMYPFKNYLLCGGLT